MTTSSPFELAGHTLGGGGPASTQRKLLSEAGFEPDPSCFGWSMTDFRGDKFTVTEQAIRSHTGQLPVRWVPPWEVNCARDS